MISYFIKSAICKVKNHTLTAAGSCPFTGNTYDYCTRCTAMVPRQDVA